MMRFAVLVGIVAVLLPGILLGPVWLSCGLGAAEDDILYYYPVRWLASALFLQGEAPVLDALTGLKRPLLADPQASLFYPTTWLFAATGPREAYASGLWLHYALALWGAYRLFRAQEISRGAALCGAIVFAFCGCMLAHRAHYTMQHAGAWLPIIFWRLQRWHADPSTRRLIIAIVCVALQGLAGHVQVAALTAMGAIVWLIATDPIAWRRTAAGVVATYLGGVCLTAMQALPTACYLAATTRLERGYWGFVENSYNPVCAVGWIFPMLLGQRVPNDVFGVPWWGPSHQVEQFAYLGLAPLLLALVAIRPGWRKDPVRRGWLILAGVALLLALGKYGPLAPVLYWLPGASAFRVPARAMLLVHLAGAFLAARTLNELANGLSIENSRLRDKLLKWVRRPFRTTALVAVVCLTPYALALLALPEPFRTRGATALVPTNPAVWLAIGLLLTTLATLKLLLAQWRRPARIYWIAALVIVDLGVIGWTIDVPREPVTRDPRLQHPAAREWLAAVRRDPGRVWHVTARQDYSPGEYIDPLRKRVANINILDGVESVTHYGPFQPRARHAAVPFEPWGELRDVERWLADSAWRERVDVKWIVLHDAVLPAPANATRVLTDTHGTRLYRATGSRGRAYLADRSIANAVQHETRGAHREQTRVSLWNAGAAIPDDTRLILANVATPGWRARDELGKELVVESTASGLLSVRLPTRDSVTVTWWYEPAGLRLGSAISAATATMLMAAFVAFGPQRGKQRRAARKQR